MKETLSGAEVHLRMFDRRGAVMPAGEFTKHVVRKIACSAGLQRIAARKESMGICFIGKRNFSEFIAQVGYRCVNA